MSSFYVHLCDTAKYNAVSHHSFAIIMYSLSKNIRNDAPWNVMFANDVRNGEMRAEGRTWVVERSLVEERNESVKSKDRVHVSE